MYALFGSYYTLSVKVLHRCVAQGHFMHGSLSCFVIITSSLRHTSSPLLSRIPSHHHTGRRLPFPTISKSFFVVLVVLSCMLVRTSRRGMVSDELSPPSLKRRGSIPTTPPDIYVGRPSCRCVAFVTLTPIRLCRQPLQLHSHLLMRRRCQFTLRPCSLIPPTTQ